MSLRAGQGLTRSFVVLWAALSFSVVLASAPAAQEGGIVSTVGSRYIPGDVSLGTSTLRLIQGTELTYANLDLSMDHSVTSDLPDYGTSPPLFDSGLVKFRRSAVVTGTGSLGPGTYGFHCQIHFGMNGTLTVVGL